MRTLSSTYPKARKVYQCIWCGELIQIGEKHFKQVGNYDGFQTNRYHLECMHPCDDEFEEFSYYRGTPVLKNDKHELASYLFGDWIC